MNTANAIFVIVMIFVLTIFSACAPVETPATATPSAEVTATLSAVPNESATATGSVLPSVTPSQTTNSTDTPSVTPATKPTATPTASPSAKPTDAPISTTPKEVELDSYNLSGLLFEEPLAKSFNYCPSIMQLEDGTRYIYYCAVKDSGVVRDHVYCRKGTPDGKGGYNWGPKTLVLAPTPGAYDAMHCCDPSVIQGNFTFNGKTYKYLMAYTGNTDSVNNKVGLAVSNELMSGWISTGSPLVTYSGDSSHWGVGQPSLVSVDKNGTVMLFYGYGGAGGTYTCAEKWDLSNLNDPKKIKSMKATENGILGHDGAKDTLNNIDVAYDPVNKCYYAARDTHPYPNDGDPAFVTAYFSLSYIPEAGNVGDLFTSVKNMQGKSWTNLLTLGPKDTGFPRNSNCGIVRDPYGWIPENGKVEVVYSISKWLGWSPDYYAWSYRMYGLTVNTNSK